MNKCDCVYMQFWVARQCNQHNKPTLLSCMLYCRERKLHAEPEGGGG